MGNAAKGGGEIEDVLISPTHGNKSRIRIALDVLSEIIDAVVRVQSKDCGLGISEVGIVDGVVEVLVQSSHAVQTVVCRHCHHGSAAVGKFDDFVIRGKFTQLRGRYTDVVVCGVLDFALETKKTKKGETIRC